MRIRLIYSEWFLWDIQMSFDKLKIMIMKLYSIMGRKTRKPTTYL